MAMSTKFSRVLWMAGLLIVLAAVPRAYASPCCNITGIDQKTGVVTARETATGRVFTFTVTNAKLLSSLKIGQGVYANFKNMQVSLDGRTAAGTIVSNSPAAAAAASSAANVASLADLAAIMQQNSNAYCICPPGQACNPPSVSIDLPFGFFNGGPFAAQGTVTVQLFRLVPGPSREIQVGSWQLSPPVAKGLHFVGKFHWVVQCASNGPVPAPGSSTPTHRLQVSLADASDPNLQNNSIELKLTSDVQILP